MLQQSHLWSLTLSLGIVTALSIASGTLSLGKNKKNTRNDTKKRGEDALLEDTDTDDSSYNREEDEEDISVQYTVWERCENTTNEFHSSERLEI